MRRHSRGYPSSTVRPRIGDQDKELMIPGLIRHYTMERYSGSVLYDETRTGDATIYNMASGAGVNGIALIGGTVDSTTRNIDLGSELTFGSFSTWLKRQDLNAYGGVVFNGVGNRTVQILIASSGNYLACYNGSWVNSDLAIADTQWHHVAGVLESTNNIRLYLDGMRAASTLAINSSVIRFIGRPGTIATQEACSFDEFRLYSSVLSQMQVQDLYNQFR